MHLSLIESNKRFFELIQSKKAGCQPTNYQPIHPSIIIQLLVMDLVWSQFLLPKAIPRFVFVFSSRRFVCLFVSFYVHDIWCFRLLVYVFV